MPEQSTLIFHRAIATAIPMLGVRLAFVLLLYQQTIDAKGIAMTPQTRLDAVSASSTHEDASLIQPAAAAAATVQEALTAAPPKMEIAGVYKTYPVPARS